MEHVDSGFGQRGEQFLQSCRVVGDFRRCRVTRCPRLPTGPIPLGANEFTYRRIRRIADRTDPLPSRGDRCGAPAQSVRTIRSSSASRSGRAPTTLNATVTVAEFVLDTWQSRVCRGRLKIKD